MIDEIKEDEAKTPPPVPEFTSAFQGAGGPDGEYGADPGPNLVQPIEVQPGAEYVGEASNRQIESAAPNSVPSPSSTMIATSAFQPPGGWKPWVEEKRTDDLGVVTQTGFGPVPPAVAEDAKRRLVEGTLFRNGIISYRVPEWDPGHISRGVKYCYITEAMIAPPQLSTESPTVALAYHRELSAAISSGTALPLKADGSAFAPDESVKAPTAEEIAEAVAYLVQAKERMAANALSDVGYFIGRAIQLLEG